MTPSAFITKWRHIELKERSAWLVHAHAALDAAVAAAYGWPADLTDGEILALLLERNRARGSA